MVTYSYNISTFKVVQDQLQRELEVQISMSKAFRAKAKAEREIRGDHVLHYSMLRDYVVELQSINPSTTVKITIERNTDPSLSTRVFRRIYLKLRVHGAGSCVCVLMNSSAYQFQIFSCTSDRQGRAKSDLLLNNICEVFNGKIVEGRDKPVITLLEYIREYCMKRIVNVQGVIDKCTGLLTPTATRIMESIKKEAHLMKVGRPKKKRKRSKHKDEPFVEDGKLSRKGRTITCQSCRNIGHNKAACKRQGGNNAEGSGSASRQAQQTELQLVLPVKVHPVLDGQGE
ncbi:hypothetical protein Tco_0990409 [Tanacetum coccineum]|uniref:Uncharacterized protein n=1 Tax=Tanacetum coccineum TaxID=301880 RepID=A0ABQ5EWN2_9ASTR